LKACLPNSDDVVGKACHRDAIWALVLWAQGTLYYMGVHIGIT